MNWVQGACFRWMVCAAAMLLPFQPLAASCCSCPPSVHQHDEDDVEEGHSQCCHHAHKSATAIEPAYGDATQSVTFHPCECPPTCPCHFSHVPQVLDRTQSEPDSRPLLTAVEATSWWTTPITSRPPVEHHDRSIVPPRFTALGLCAALCRFTT